MESLTFLLMATFGFIGQSYQNASLRANAQESVNLYYEKDQSGSGKSPAQLVGTPGLAAFSSLPSSPVRGIWIGDARTFVVAGSRLYEVFQDGSYDDRGDVGNDGNPVEIVPNGNQIAIASSGYLWVDAGSGPARPTYPSSSATVTGAHYYAGLSATKLTWVSGDKFDATMDGQSATVGAYTGTFTFVSDTVCYISGNAGLLSEDTATMTISGRYIPASSVVFLDGYGIFGINNSRQFGITGLYDFSSVDPIDVALKEGYPDVILRVFAHQQELWLFGKQTAEVWRDTGNPDFPFERVGGMVLNLGLQAKYSLARLGTGIAGLFGDERGAPVAQIIDGYQPKRFSTHAIEKIWQGYSTVADSIAYSYEDAGHTFYVVSFPTADATWCYDLTTGMWHQRGYWDGSALRMVKGAFHGYVWGKHIVGAHDSGALYVMSLDTDTDAGQPILRRRAAPHISDEDRRTFFHQFQLDVQTGAINRPTFTLDWSVDGGNTFINARTLDGGLTGEFATRLIARRLGSSRDRVFRVSSTAAMRHVWIEAYVMTTPGAN